MRFVFLIGHARRAASFGGVTEILGCVTKFLGCVTEFVGKRDRILVPEFFGCSKKTRSGNPNLCDRIFLFFIYVREISVTKVRVTHFRSPDSVSGTYCANSVTRPPGFGCSRLACSWVYQGLSPLETRVGGTRAATRAHGVARVCFVVTWPERFCRPIQPPPGRVRSPSWTCRAVFRKRRPALRHLLQRPRHFHMQNFGHEIPPTPSSL